MKKIGVLDCNNFFVSCERLMRPDLQNKPVVVLSGNDGCVVARSKEIKDIGISMGVPYFQVKDILKEKSATVFSSNFPLYRDISNRVFETLRGELQSIEQYSIDEAFFYIDENDLSRLNDIKKRVERWVGIPVSIGVAGSKTQAKYVNSVAKRTGMIEVWNNDKFGEKFSEIKLVDIWGVGKSLNEKFRKSNLIYMKDFISMSDRYLSDLFGINAVRLKSELLGIPVYEVIEKKIVKKSIMSSNSLSKPTSDILILRSEIDRHVHAVAQELFASKLLASRIKIAIYPSRFGDFLTHGFSLEAQFSTPANDLFLLTKEANKLLKQGHCRDIPYKRIVVMISGLVSTNLNTPTLFQVEKKKNETQALSNLVFGINKKHKNSLIYLGSSTKSKVTNFINKEHLSPEYTTSWSSIKTVKI